MITVIIVSMIALGIFTYIIIVSSNMNKTDEEKEREDREQQEAIRNYQNGGNSIESKNGKTSLYRRNILC